MSLYPNALRVNAFTSLNALPCPGDYAFMNRTAKNLEALLKARDMSANDLADAVRVHQPTVSRIINGTSKSPRDDTLEPLAAYFGLSVNQLKQTPTDKIVALAAGHVAPEQVTPDEAVDLRQQVLQLFAALGTLAGWIAVTRPAEAPLLRAGLEEAAQNVGKHGARDRLDSLIAALPATPVTFPLQATQSRRS